jgi:hypothetical protein
MFKRFKVKFYLKSGSIFTMRFKEFEISRLTSTLGKRKMTFGGESRGFTIDVDELEAVVIKKRF